MNVETRTKNRGEDRMLTYALQLARSHRDGAATAFCSAPEAEKELCRVKLCVAGRAHRRYVAHQIHHSPAFRAVLGRTRTAELVRELWTSVFYQSEPEEASR